MNIKKAKPKVSPDPAALIDRQYGCGPVHFAGTSEALYERHLLFDNIVDLASGDSARSLRGGCPFSARHSVSAMALN